MLARFHCPGCRRRLKTTDQPSSRKSFTCPKCGGRFQFPTGAQERTDGPPVLPSGTSPVTAFISHATDDREFVERHIIGPLRENGIATWYCKDAIQPAAKWERQIVKGIKLSTVFLLVMSPHSARSEWVRDEVTLALEYLGDSGIVPLMIATCEAESFHIRICRLQYLDFRHNQVTAAAQLISRLQGADVSQASAPGTRLHGIGRKSLVLVFIVLVTLGAVAIRNRDRFPRWTDTREGTSTGSLDGSQQVFVPEQSSFSYTIQVRFAGPSGMKVRWLVRGDEPEAPGVATPPLQLPGSDVSERPKLLAWKFSSEGLEVPGRYDFRSGGRYRLKLADVPDRPGLELYPSLEVKHCPRLDSLDYAKSSAVSVNLTEQQLAEIVSGQEVVMVWYLTPLGELARLPPPLRRVPAPSERSSVASPANLPLAPPPPVPSPSAPPDEEAAKVDVVAEARKLGTPLVIFRVGNIDLENPRVPRTDDP